MMTGSGRCAQYDSLAQPLEGLKKPTRLARLGILHPQYRWNLPPSPPRTRCWVSLSFAHGSFLTDGRCSAEPVSFLPDWVAEMAMAASCLWTSFGSFPLSMVRLLPHPQPTARCLLLLLKMPCRPMGAPGVSLPITTRDRDVRSHSAQLG